MSCPCCYVGQAWPSFTAVGWDTYIQHENIVYDDVLRIHNIWLGKQIKFWLTLYLSPLSVTHTTAELTKTLCFWMQQYFIYYHKNKDTEFNTTHNHLSDSRYLVITMQIHMLLVGLVAIIWIKCNGLVRISSFIVLRIQLMMLCLSPWEWSVLHLCVKHEALSGHSQRISSHWSRQKKEQN